MFSFKWVILNFKEWLHCEFIGAQRTKIRGYQKSFREFWSKNVHSEPNLLALSQSEQLIFLKKNLNKYFCHSCYTCRLDLWGLMGSSWRSTWNRMFRQYFYSVVCCSVFCTSSVPAFFFFFFLHINPHTHIFQTYFIHFKILHIVISY